MLGRFAVCFILSLTLISCASLDSESKAIKSVYDTGVVVPVYEGYFKGTKTLNGTSTCSIQVPDSEEVEMDIITISNLEVASVIFGDDKTNEFAGDIVSYKKEKNDKAVLYIVKKKAGYNEAYLLTFLQDYLPSENGDQEKEIDPGEKSVSGTVMIMEEVSPGEFADCADYSISLHSTEKPANWLRGESPEDMPETTK